MTKKKIVQGFDGVKRDTGKILDLIAAIEDEFLKRTDTIELMSAYELAKFRSWRDEAMREKDLLYRTVSQVQARKNSQKILD